MTAFQLDTSGAVRIRAGRTHFVKPWAWSDLDAFTQGYIAAMFADWADGVTEDDKQEAHDAACRFSALAPEALASILADCEAFMAAAIALSGIGKAIRQMREAGSEAQRGARMGATFWHTRQREGSFNKEGWSDPHASSLVIKAWDFPPLSPWLGDDGRVYL